MMSLIKTTVQTIQNFVSSPRAQRGITYTSPCVVSLEGITILEALGRRGGGLHSWTQDSGKWVRNPGLGPHSALGACVHHLTRVE